MKKSDHVEIETRTRNYEKIFKDECIFPQEMPRSEQNVLGNGAFTLMHAYFMTLQIKELHKEGGEKKAFYLLGLVEAILSAHKLLTLDEMFY